MDKATEPLLYIGFASTNPHKIRETEACFEAMLPGRIRVVPLPPSIDVEETGATFYENARIKLDACLSSLLPPEIHVVLAEDSGLIIPALAGTFGLNPFPGVTSDRWLSPEAQQALFGTVTPNPDYALKNNALLQLMEGISNREAYYEACISGFDRQKNHYFKATGTVRLEVSRDCRGKAGFGYDPIIIPIDYDPARTMAQLHPDEKNTISHRHQALAQLVQGHLTLADGGFKRNHVLRHG